MMGPKALNALLMTSLSALRTIPIPILSVTIVNVAHFCSLHQIYKQPIEGMKRTEYKRNFQNSKMGKGVYGTTGMPGIFS